MIILQKNKVRFVNDETSKSNPDSNSGIYLNADKLEQCRLVYCSRREK